MKDYPNYLTVAAVPLPPGVVAEVTDGTETWSWLAPALLVQHFEEDGLTKSRVIVGVLNPFRGEVETYDLDSPGQDHLVNLHWPVVAGPKASLSDLTEIDR